MDKHPFDYHRPTPEQTDLISKLRDRCKEMHDLIQAEVPRNAERTLAIRKLEEVSMWINKAIVMADPQPLEAATPNT